VIQRNSIRYQEVANKRFIVSITYPIADVST